MGIKQISEDFEVPSRDWFFTGGAGFDHGKGLARKGQGNAWVRNTTGWNAINRWYPVDSDSVYTVYAWLRLSPTLTDGYMSVRNDKENRPDRSFSVIRETRLVFDPSRPDYSPYQFDFYTGINTRVLLYVGLWGIGTDAWIQIDDISISTQTPF